MKTATKAQDKRRISTLRLVSAAIKDRDIAARTAGKGEATDAELLELFAKMIKQREESEKIYADAGRAELAKQEGEEIVIIREFLPKQLSDADTREGDRRRHRRSRRRERQGHGQGDGRAESALRRPDGFRQGERCGEGEARMIFAAADRCLASFPGEKFVGRNQVQQNLLVRLKESEGFHGIAALAAPVSEEVNAGSRRGQRWLGELADDAAMPTSPIALLRTPRPVGASGA